METTVIEQQQKIFWKEKFKGYVKTLQVNSDTHLNSSRIDFIEGSHSIEDELYNFVKIIIPDTPRGISQEYNICLGPFAYWGNKKEKKGSPRSHEFFHSSEII